MAADVFYVESQNNTAALGEKLAHWSQVLKLTTRRSTCPSNCPTNCFPPSDHALRSSLLAVGVDDVADAHRDGAYALCGDLRLVPAGPKLPSNGRQSTCQPAALLVTLLTSPSPLLTDDHFRLLLGNPWRPHVRRRTH